MSDFDHVLSWLEQLEMNQGRSPQTVAKYRGYLHRLQAYLIEEKDCDLLTANKDHLLEFSGIYMHQQGLKPKSRKSVVAAIRGFYSWAWKNRLVTDDLARHVESPKAGRRLPDVASLQTVEALMMAMDLSTLKGIRDCSILSLMAGCGLRVSGVVALNESNLIWTELDGKERLVIKVREKGGKERLVPAPFDVFLMLRAYLGHPDLEGIDRSLPDGDRVLFVSLNNRTITPDKYHGEERRMRRNAVNDMLKRYGKRAMLPKNELHAHAFRHLFGTELAEEGHNLREIQELMGHADINTTSIYVHLATRRLAKTVDKSNPLSKIRTPFSDLAKSLRG